MSNLDKVMSKLNSQKSKKVEEVEEVPEIEPAKPKKKVKKVEEVPEIEPVEEEEEEEEDEEDENGEVPVEEKGLEVVEKSKEDPAKISQQGAEEIQILQNDGVFRVELLYQLGALNKNIVDLNTLIAGVIENAK